MNNSTRWWEASPYAIEALEDRRLLSAGDLDPSFSGDGKASFSFPGAAFSIHATAVQPNGKIVLAGVKGAAAAVVRLNVDGTVDTSFGNAGLTEFGSMINNAVAVAIQADGKIIVAGSNGTGGFGHPTFAVARLNADGTSPAYQPVPFADGYSAATCIAVQKDGKVVVGGYALTGFTSVNEDFVAVRFNSLFTRDSTFGNGGVRIMGFDAWERVTSVAIDYNGTPASNPLYGKITLAGLRYNDNIDDTSSRSFVVARLNTNGSFDNGFDGDGSRGITFAGLPFSAARGVVIQPGGKTVVIGDVSSAAAPTSTDYKLIRLNANGATDTTFGPSGTGESRFSLGGRDVPLSLTIGYDLHLLAAGVTDGKFGLAVFTSEGRLETSFQAGGKLVNSYTNGAAFAVGPNRTFVAASGSNVARYFDLAPTIQLGSFDTDAVESPLNTASLIFTRSERLPFPTVIYVNMDGTAAYSADYTGITLYEPPIGGSTSLIRPRVGGPLPMTKIGVIEIPANETVVTATIRPLADGKAEPIEFAIFTLRNGTFYDVGSAKTVTTRISDTPPTAGATLNATADAYVQDGGSAGTNFGTAATLQSKTTTAVGSNRQSYLKFDLSSVSAVHTAKLRLFGRLNNADATNIAVGIFSVANTSWTESGINFNNKPAGGTTALATAVIVDQTNRWYEFDVTAYLQAEKAAGRNIVSLLLRNMGNSSPAAVFSSDEATANRPEVVIS